MPRGYGYRPWTKEDEAYLIRNYGKMPLDCLAKQMGRSPKTLPTRAWILGLFQKRVYELKLTPEDAAWLACAIDSEGCVQFRKRIKKQSGTPSYTIQVLIMNTDWDYVMHAKEIVGFGYVKHQTLMTNPKRNSLYSQMYVLVIQGRSRVAAVMSAVYDHLIIKKERADVLIEAGKITPGRIWGKRKADMERLEMLYGMMHRMGYGRSGKYRPSSFSPIRYHYFGA